MEKGGMLNMENSSFLEENSCSTFVEQLVEFERKSVQPSGGFSSQTPLSVPLDFRNGNVGKHHGSGVAVSDLREGWAGSSGG